MREVILSLYHHGCVGCKTSEKFPEVRMNVSPVVYHEKKQDGSGTFSAVWRFEGKKNEADGAYQFAKGLRATTKATLLEQDPVGITAYMVMRSQNTALDRIIASNCTPLRPVQVSEELEHWRVITEDVRDVSKLVDGMSEIGEVRVRGIRNYKPEKKLYELTRKQLDALQTAAENGYYGWPRRLSLEEVAIKTRTPRSTLQTHLRKAETKVISRFLKETEGERSFLF